MEIKKKINPDLQENKIEMEQVTVLSSYVMQGNNHPLEKEEPDEVIIPRNDGIDTEEIPDEVKIPRKDDNVTEEIPDEVVVPRNDDSDSNEMPDEVVIPRKETNTETL